MKTTLILMAAGMGSRYGGNKQIDGLGPNNEILMEYAVYDAIKAGFNKIVFIIKPDMVNLMEKLCGDKIRRQKDVRGKPVEVEYVFQDFSSIPGFYEIPRGRIKPFGTTHALLCAKDVIHEPFAVINADDFYGSDAMRKIHDAIIQLPEEGGAAMVAYTLKKTVSENGTVSRGICTVEDGRLSKVTETYKIMNFPDGSIRDIENGEDGKILDPNSLVSMNLWGFTPWIFGELEHDFEAFLTNLPEGEMKKECVLPGTVDGCIKRGTLGVTVLCTDSDWFGVTYKEDKQLVKDDLRKLHQRGAYPDLLWE